MKIMLKITILLLSILVVATLGYFQLYQDPIDEMLDILQVKKMLNSQKDMAKKLVKKQTDNILEQMKNTYPDISDSMAILLEPVFDEYSKTILDSWQTSEIMSIYRKYLSSALTKDQLLKALEFYKTDDGKKILKTLNDATNEISTYIRDRSYKTSIEANKKLIDDVKEVLTPKLKYYYMH